MNPLYWHHFLVDYRPLGVQGDLVLFLADGRPDSPASRLASLIVSRSIRPSSWLPGSVCCTVSVTRYLRSRARPVCSVAVPTRIRSSERVIASSVVGPEMS